MIINLKLFFLNWNISFDLAEGRHPQIPKLGPAGAEATQI